MGDGSAVGIGTTHCRILARIFAIWLTVDAEASRRFRTVSVSVEANVRIVTSRMNQWVSNESLGTRARVTSRGVLANGGRVTRMSQTLIDINATQSSVVFVSFSTAANRLTISYHTRTIRFAINLVARVSAFEFQTLVILQAVGIL